MSPEPGASPVTRKEVWWIKRGSSAFRVLDNYRLKTVRPGCGRACGKPGPRVPRRAEGRRAQSRPGSRQRAIQKRSGRLFINFLNIAFLQYVSTSPIRQRVQEMFQ